MSRMPELEDAKLSPEQRRVRDAIVAGPRGRVEGPLKVWLHSPKFAERAQELGAFCRFGTSLPPQLSELAILLTASYWRAGFEWAVHAPQALKAGLDPDVVEAIRLGRKPVLTRTDEAAVYAFASELLRKRRVSVSTYRIAVAELGRTGVVDLVGILGYYTLISMTIVAFKVPLPTDAPDPFAIERGRRR
jgi:4-carboxymuconolactone decarboxylase